MSRHRRTRLGALLLPLVMAGALAACDRGPDVEEDPRSALRDAVMELSDYDGVELVFGAQLDEAARQSATTEGELTEDELTLLTGSTLTVRGVAGDDEDEGQSEFELIVGDESVLTVRVPSESELYALIDLPAVERVAEELDAGPGFAQGVSEVEQMAGMFGLGEVATAAREAEWVRVTGVDEVLETTREGAGEEEPDEADLEQLARDVGERLLAFLEDDVAVEHVGDEDAGERIRVTAAGTELRALLTDLLTALDDATDLASPAGTGMDPAQLRDELEESIPDDTEVSFDAWVDDGELAQVAVDLFALAREAGEEDVPDGEFLVAIGIAEFTGPVEAPETDVTFDVFELFGDLLGGLGDLDDESFPEGSQGGLGDEGAPGPDEDACISEDEVEQLLERLPEEQRDLDDDEVEEVLGLPIC